MRKELSYLLIVCLSLSCILNLGFVNHADAIPNSGTPPPDGHPHSCGEPRFNNKFIDGTVTWTSAAVDPYNAQGALQNPDDICHQHRSNRNFGGHGNTANEPYSANKVWDDESLRYSQNNPFDRGHGFINEFPEAGGGSSCIPDYYFSLVHSAYSLTPGAPCNWPAAAQARIRDAFNAWGAIESDKVWLATGIAFEETASQGNAEIVIYWEDLDVGVQGEFIPTDSPTTLRFNDTGGLLGPWFFNVNPAGIGPNEYHFYTIALHETGHAIGFVHQNDLGDLMFEGIGNHIRGGADNLTFFQSPTQDAGCMEGVRDLYSIPTPDFGDAPDPTYPTLKASNGGRSLFIGREWLGSNPTGQTTTSWEWEAKVIDRDVPDDGLIFRFPPGGGAGILFIDARVSVTNCNSPRYKKLGYGLCLAIWIDFDENGWWEHPGNLVVMDALDPSTWGMNTTLKQYRIVIPEWTPLWIRARILYTNKLNNVRPWGLLPLADSADNGGEVEDYPLCLRNTSKPWTMFGCDINRDRYTSSPGPCSNRTLWTCQPGGSIMYSSPAISDGRIFVGSVDGRVYALDFETGDLLWNYTTGNWIGSSPAVTGGKVYVSSCDGYFYALNASNGGLLWRYPTGGGTCSPTIAEGKVFVGSLNHSFYAFTEDGAVLWNYTAGEFIESCPAVADGKVYFGSADGYVHALNITNGARIWINNTGGWIYSSPAVVDGKLYIGSTDGKVYCMDAQSGNFEWNYSTGGSIYCSPAVAGGIVFTGSNDGNAYALDAATGTLVWQKPIGYGGYSSPAIACKKKLYIATSSGEIYSLQPESGTILWTYQTGSPVYSSPAVSDGTMYIGASNGKVYAFRSRHDVSVVTASASKSIVGQGYSMDFTVTVRNIGDFPENFDVVVGCINYTMACTASFTLDTGNTTTISFTWNTTDFVKGNYTVCVYAWPVSYETDTNDNVFDVGPVTLTIAGDVTSAAGPPDGKVDMRDIGVICGKFGTTPSSSGWNPNIDINNDGVVNMRDIGIACSNFGKI